MTWRAAAAQLVAAGFVPSLGPADLRLIRCTVANMAKAGELQVCTQVKCPGSRRPMVAYCLPDARPAHAPDEPWLLLSAALRP